jgi:hypothetical protein
MDRVKQELSNSANATQTTPSLFFSTITALSRVFTFCTRHTANQHPVNLPVHLERVLSHQSSPPRFH